MAYQVHSLHGLSITIATEDVKPLIKHESLPLAAAPLPTKFTFFL